MLKISRPNRKSESKHLPLKLMPYEMLIHCWRPRPQDESRNHHLL